MTTTSNYLAKHVCAHLNNTPCAETFHSWEEGAHTGSAIYLKVKVALGWATYDARVAMKKDNLYDVTVIPFGQIPADARDAIKLVFRKFIERPLRRLIDTFFPVKVVQPTLSELVQNRLMTYFRYHLMEYRIRPAKSTAANILFSTDKVGLKFKSDSLIKLPHDNMQNIHSTDPVDAVLDAKLQAEVISILKQEGITP